MGNLAKLFSGATSTIEVFDRLGVTPEQWEGVRKDEKYAKCVAEAFKNGRLAGSSSQQLARFAISKDRYWGPEQWVAHYNYPFTRKQLRQAAKMPWSPEELEEKRKTHFLHLGVPTLPDGDTPLTVLALNRGALSGVAPVWVADYLKDKEPITTKTMELRWYLTRIEIVEKSTSLSYDHQLPLLGAEEQPPTAIEEVMKSLLLEKLTGIKVNPKVYARTADLLGTGNVVCVGSFVCLADGALYVLCSPRDYAWGPLGLGASRKFQS